MLREYFFEKVLPMLAAVAVIACLVAILLFLTEDRTDEPSSVAFILGNHRNSYALNLSHAVIQDNINKVAANFGYFLAVVADGRPLDQLRILDYSSYRGLDTRAQRLTDREGIEANKQRRVDEIMLHLESAVAQAPEVDMLAALDAASSQLQSRPEGEEKKLIVIGTGLSTTGHVNLAENRSHWLYYDSGVLLAQLIAHNNLPDLRGIHVVWFQMGAVCGIDQPTFSGNQMANLHYLWTSIVTAAGGTLEIRSENPGAEVNNDPDLPHVRVAEVRPSVNLVSVAPNAINLLPGESTTFSESVFVENDAPQSVIWDVFDNIDPKTVIDENGFLTVGADEQQGEVLTVRALSTYNQHVFGEALVGVGVIPDPLPEPPSREPLPHPDVVEVNFHGDQPEADLPFNNGIEYMINREQAQEDIKEWIDFINSQGEGVFLFGTTAKSDSPENERFDSHVLLGYRRAEAVKLLFVEAGVDPNKIRIKGLGYSNPWFRDNGIANTPTWNNLIASENRRVFIISQDDAFAQTVYDGSWKDDSF